MTRPSTVSRNLHKGTGATATFSYTWPVDLEGDIFVVEQLIATGAETVLVLGSGNDYTTTGVGSKTGGTVILTAGNLPSTKKLLIRRKPTKTQLTDIRNQGTYFPETQEKALDKLNDIVQDIADDIARTMIFAETTDISTFDSTIPVPVADKLIKISSDALSLELATLVAGSNISLPAGLKIMVQTAAGVFTARDITKVGNIVVTNGDGQSGNMIIDSSAIDTAVALVQTNLDTSNKKGMPAANVSWKTGSTTTCVIDSGSRFRGVSSGDWFEFSTNRTFDITATKGLGAINTLVAGSATANEAANTSYVLIGVGDTTAVLSPHIVAVSEAEYATFVTTDLTALGYDDYKRIGHLHNNAISDLEPCQYRNGEGFFDDEAAYPLTTASASFADMDYSTIIPSFIRSVRASVFNGSVATSFWRNKDLGGAGQTIQGAAAMPNRSNLVLNLNSSGIFEAKTSAGTLNVFLHGYLDTLEEEGQ